VDLLVGSGSGSLSLIGQITSSGFIVSSGKHFTGTFKSSASNPSFETEGSGVGKGVKFGPGNAATDTTLARGATAGSMLINGKAIQVAAIAADGTEVTIESLHDTITAQRSEIDALKAELGPMRELLADVQRIVQILQDGNG
jgi:hypothetical protein